MADTPHTPGELRARIEEIAEDIDFTMFTTVGDDGSLHSRPMSTNDIDDNGDIWFFTSDEGQKADEVRADRRVNLAYSDKKAMRYVSVFGYAEIVHDRAKMEKLYTPELSIWFEDGLDTPGIALLRVTPESAEYWDPKGNRITRSVEYFKALVTRDTPDSDIMDNQKVDLA